NGPSGDVLAQSNPQHSRPETGPTPDPEVAGSGNGTTDGDGHRNPDENPKDPITDGSSEGVVKPKEPIKPDDPGTERPFTSPEMEMFKPAIVKPPFALLENVRDIQADKLRREIEKETALRIELPCRDTAKGFRRVQAALKEVGI